MKKKIIYFLLFYIISFCYSFFFSTVYNDEIWNYGFSYNIASGLIPYRDFGMLQTPLYFYFASFFIKIFGNYLFYFHLFNSFILAGIIYIIFDKLGYKAFILIPFVFLNCYPGYNIFSILLLLIILNLLEKDLKNENFIIGLLVGLMFLTKQNIGICLFIPLLYYSRDKYKSCFGFLFPTMFFLSYLILNDSLFEFIDYCFLGMFNFGESNSILLFFPLELIICLIILYKLIKSNFDDKQLFYILMYQVVTVPIFDDYHFFIGFIPVLYYFLLVSEIEYYKIKYFIIISFFTFFCWNFIIHEFDNLNFYKDKDSYLYGRNIPIYVELNEITKFIQSQSSYFDHIYFFSKNSFYVKLNANYPLDKYDMILNGNMGYNGTNRYLNEIDNYCLNHKCMFILYDYEFENKINQTNKEFISFVKNNYSIFDKIEYFSIYVN